MGALCGAGRDGGGCGGCRIQLVSCNAHNSELREEWNDGDGYDKAIVGLGDCAAALVRKEEEDEESLDCSALLLLLLLLALSESERTVRGRKHE